MKTSLLPLADTHMHMHTRIYKEVLQKIYFTSLGARKSDIFRRVNPETLFWSFYSNIGSSADHRNARNSKDSGTADKTAIYLQKLL